ncbi:hypothetical protein HN418_01095, partial [archaeon]|nr:hypothetical protein [archaeon]
MKKIGAFVILFLLVLSVAPFAFAAEGDTCSEDSDCDSGEECSSDDLCVNETVPTTTAADSSSTSSQQDPDKTEEGFECLEEKA